MITPEQQILTFVLILSRVSAFIAFLPLFARRQLPMTVKSGLATALTIFWFGALPVEDYVTQDINFLTATLLICKEIGIGFLLATLFGFIFVPARIAGAYVGQEVGLSLASVTSPSGTDSSTLVTTIFESLAILLFFGLNLHHYMIVFLHLSLVQLAGKIELHNLPTELLVQMTASLSEFGILIIAPVGICMFVLTVSLGLLNKAAPSLNLFSVGMSLRSGLGILCMFVFMPVIVGSFKMFFERYQADLQSFLMYFS
ncbi:MAG: flagellar biosynthetic protein FliR [Mariniblastus sp.]